MVALFLFAPQITTIIDFTTLIELSASGKEFLNPLPVFQYWPE